MNLTIPIESAELQVKQILEEFFISVYDEKSLPSHGIEHHRRVWNYSKQLLILLADQNRDISSHLPLKLIIVSYLHDIGMSVETGIRHGKHSRDLCIQFLNKNNFRITEYQDVLEAIECHDRKDYDDNMNENILLRVLSVADDLDAFGFTGIFRYSEIYLTREINYKTIGNLINENAGKRFENFTKTFGFSSELVQKHKHRYNILKSFFIEFTNQVSNYKFGSHHPSGYCGVIEVVHNMMNYKISLNEIYRKPKIYLTDPVIKWFFDGLKYDLSIIN
jgi:HD superfamily phosphodiesterase